MSLSVGIVGLPNVGKSTLFNALLKKQSAFAKATADRQANGLAIIGNYPFTTIEPNIGVVPVPDERLEKLAEVVANEGPHPSPLLAGEGIGVRLKRPPIVPSTMKFLDIAGLVKDAHKGEGLGNKFLSHIRECDAICHVIRCFSDENIIKAGSVDPKSDFETVKTELDLADLEMEDRHKTKKGEDDVELPLFAQKPILIVLNVDENELVNAQSLEKKWAGEFEVETDQVAAICAKTEMELAELNEEEQLGYLRELGVVSGGLERLIGKAFATLGLMTFLTAPDSATASSGKGWEVRAWTIKKGTTAPQAAGVIHTDFEKGFIKAAVVSFEDFVKYGGWKGAAEMGKVRQEGRDYIMKDGDVVEFKFSV